MAKSSPSKRPTTARGFNAAEIAAVQKAADKSSSRTPLEVLGAFSQQPILCGDLSMAPLSLATFMLLERIESPLVDEQGALEITAADTAAAVFILTHPVEDSLGLLGKGREHFDTAVYAFASRLPATELPAIGLKLRETFQAAFATVVASQKKTAG